MPKIKPSRPGSKHKGYYGNKVVKKDTGGIVMHPVGMQVAIKTPCVECPFRRDSAPGYLGGYSPNMYMDVVLSPASLACHKSEGFHEGEIEKQRHCTGLAAFRANLGWIASVDVGGVLVPTIAHASTKIVGADQEVYFGTATEFIEHHTKGQQDSD